jgi:hypothetical protein
MKKPKVLSVSEMYSVFSSYDKDLLEQIIGEELVIVNRRSGMIVGKVKVMKPPKKVKHIQTYYYPKKDNNDK